MPEPSPPSGAGADVRNSRKPDTAKPAPPAPSPQPEQPEQLEQLEPLAADATAGTLTDSEREALDKGGGWAEEGEQFPDWVRGAGGADVVESDASGLTAQFEQEKDSRVRIHCHGKGRQRRCDPVVYFDGHRVRGKPARATPLQPSGDIDVKVLSSGAVVRGNIADEDTVARIDRAFRCRRTGEIKPIDRRLLPVLSAIYDHFDRQQILLVSGFRYQKNQKSRHFHAAAMDLKIEGVRSRELYDFAVTLDAGGMGIGQYPFPDFVHIDFRAEGAPSFRWTDITPKGYSDRGRSPPDGWKAKSAPGKRGSR